MTDRREFLTTSSGWMAAISTVSFAVPSRAELGYERGPIVHRAFPLNREPRPPRLASGFLTSQSDFYVRNHGTLPALSEAGYSIRIDVAGRPPVVHSLAELRSQFDRKSIPAVMQCAGNRRVDMGKFKSVSGDAWRVGAIGNAVWTGIGLGDVLRRAGVGDAGDLHVAFAAHDDVEEEGEKFKYGVSIPLAKALSPETLIVFEMNGETLSVEHGFPVRIVVPGYAGVRSPKWLASVRVQPQPSDNHVQQKEYKLFSPEVTSQTADVTKAPFINDMPLNSAILLPADGAVIASGPTQVRGYAIATSHRVVRVEISADQGRSWTRAVIEEHVDAPWSWTPWSAVVNLPKGRVELCVRAVDSSGGSQPSTPAPIWNFPGYLSRSWHRVAVHTV